MRFDDSLETVLAGDATTPFGAQSAWRQLVDLVGRGRADASPEVIARLLALRERVPSKARAASARAVAAGDPPAALVRLFATDDVRVAAPVLRSARLDAPAWIAMLPAMAPATRSILRHRRDLPPAVVRALATFGPVDFVLAGGGAVAEIVVAVGPTGTSDFVAVGAVAAGLPLVAEALERSDSAALSEEQASLDPDAGNGSIEGDGTFQVSELVARIDAFQREREAQPPVQPRAEVEPQAELFAAPAIAPRFRFETDAAGIVRWVEGAPRAALIGLTLDRTVTSVPQVDGAASGAFRHRASFADARLLVAGDSPAAGQWRISGVPVFDPLSGRFTGYRGAARRPRADELAESLREAGSARQEGLRALVHELRTPANAVVGFAELIESELYGPVPAPYRQQASAIRDQAHALIGAIEDIDLAARIDAAALDLRPGEVLVAPLLGRIAGDLAPLANLRGATLDVDAGPVGLSFAGDDRAIERLVARLLSTMLSATERGERITVSAATDLEHGVSLTLDRPRAFVGHAGIALLDVDADREDNTVPLLGTGFALRLARNLAAELGGSLTFGERLTLRLPAAFLPEVEQVSSS